jgi:tetratricopeptide (TPR) repeat protein
LTRLLIYKQIIFVIQIRGFNMSLSGLPSISISSIEARVRELSLTDRSPQDTAKELILQGHLDEALLVSRNIPVISERREINKQIQQAWLEQKNPEKALEAAKTMSHFYPLDYNYEDILRVFIELGKLDLASAMTKGLSWPIDIEVLKRVAEAWLERGDIKKALDTLEAMSPGVTQEHIYQSAKSPVYEKIVGVLVAKENYARAFDIAERRPVFYEKKDVYEKIVEALASKAGLSATLRIINTSPHGQGQEFMYARIVRLWLEQNEIEKALDITNSMPPEYQIRESLYLDIALSLIRQGKFEKALNIAQTQLTFLTENVCEKIAEAMIPREGFEKAINLAKSLPVGLCQELLYKKIAIILLNQGRLEECQSVVENMPPLPKRKNANYETQVLICIELVKAWIARKEPAKAIQICKIMHNQTVAGAWLKEIR